VDKKAPSGNVENAQQDCITMIKPFLKKEQYHEESPGGFHVVGLGVGRLDYGLRR